MKFDPKSLEASLEPPVVFIVDDEQSNLNAMKANLRNLNVRAYEATNGKDLLNSVEKVKPSCIILDVHLPDIDGYNLAEEIRKKKNLQSVPIVFVTGVFKQEMHIFKGYEYGAFSYLTKPYDQEDLLRKVKFFIEKDRQDRLIIKMQKTLKDRVKKLEQTERELKKTIEQDEFKQHNLEITNKELDSFRSVVTHDLKSPIRAVKGFSEHLKKKYYSSLNNEAQKWLDFILENANLSESMINNIVYYSNIRKLKIWSESIDMKKLVHETWKELTHEHEGKIDLKIENLPKAKGDYNLLKLVWINLLDNAIKFTGEVDNPTILISGKSKGNQITYKIEDNGIGFDNKYEEGVFEIFQRFHSRKIYKGNGVGLAVVQKAIQKHNGTIKAYGKPEKGASITFALPREIK